MSRQDTSAKLVAYAALKKALAVLETDLRQEGVTDFKPRDRETVEIDGEEVGSVTRRRDVVDVEIKDAAAFRAWVEETRPEKIIREDAWQQVIDHPATSYVDPEWVATLVDEWKSEKVAVDFSTGDLLDFVSVTIKPGGLMVTPVRGAWEKIRDSVDWALTLSPTPEIES